MQHNPLMEMSSDDSEQRIVYVTAGAWNYHEIDCSQLK